MSSAGDRSANDVVTLRDALAAAERRAATLAELTALMSEGRNPLALAQRAVELTARATRAAGAFVYLWDRDEELLVLRVATEGYQRGHLGRIKLRMGEGITGWAALMRQTVMVPQDPQKDPRCKPFPELRESSFKSMVAVPIVAPGEEVLGVFTLYGLAEGAFASTDVNLATEVGSLLASGLMQAETLGQLRTQSAAVQFLHNLPEDAWGSVDSCLQAMAAQCVIELDADVCLIELTTDVAQPQGGMNAVAMSPRFRDAHCEADQEQIDRASVAQLLAPLDLERLRIPLGAAGPIGALTCYRGRRFNGEDERLAEGIGAQVAAGLLSIYGAERVRPLLDQLLHSPDAGTTERLLSRLAWKSRAAWASVIRLHSTGAARDRDEESLRAALTEVTHGLRNGSLLVGRDGHYLVLVDGTKPKIRDELLARIEKLALQSTTRLTAGVGPIVSDSTEMHRGLKHALLASRWADMAGPPTVVRYEDIAHFRLLPAAALSMTGRLKELFDSLGVVVGYDMEHGTDLAQTLDSFLTNSGSVAKSSSELFIHRNTLRQRIQRIEELIGQSPESFDDWVAAGLAARLIMQSESELKRPAGNREPRTCPRGVVTIGRACCGLPSSCVHVN